MNQLDMPMDYHVWDATLERYHETHTDVDQHCQAERLFADDME